AVAAVVLLISRIGDTPGTDEIESLRGPMRGNGTEKTLIIPETPAGEVDTLTGTFTWKSEKNFDYFLLEVFTSDLTRVYQSGKIEDTLIVVPDSINAVFNKNRIYIWNVRGFSGLEKSVISKNKWFKVVQKGK
ncbi:hypothetical protein J7M07_00555, partial [bacterium]|nr:hypothetical protein [bacterium]